MSWYHKVNEKKSYHRPIFLVSALGTAALCSVYPLCCWKNYSSKERNKLKKKTEELEARQKEEELWHREHRPKEISGLEGRRHRTESGTEPQQATYITRSGSGSPAAESPPRSCSSSSIPSQFLGGRTGPDANLLRTRSDSIKDYKSSQQEVVMAQMQAILSSSPTPISLPRMPSFSVVDRSNSFQKTPTSEISHFSYAELPSSTSEESSASSFPYHLRRKEPDTRLLKKRSKPFQHLAKKPSMLRPAPITSRSSSFYKPKVVADTGFVESTTTGLHPSSPVEEPLALTLPKSKVGDADPPIKPLRKALTLKAPSLSKSSVMSLQVPASIKKSVVSFSHSLPSLQHPEEHTRQPRFHIPQIPEAGYGEPASTVEPTGLTRAGLPKHGISHNQVTTEEPLFQAVTPIKMIPNTPGKHASRNLDSYFPAVGSDVVPVKDFMPPKTPAPIDEGKKRIHGRPPLNSDRVPKHSSGLVARGGMSSPINEYPAPDAKKRKESRRFSAFRKAQFNNNVFGDRSEGPSSPPPPSASTKATPLTPPTPGIRIHRVDSLAMRRRLSSIVPDLATPSYFTRPMFRRDHSDSTLSPTRGATPLSTADDESPSAVARFGGRTRGHNRSSSEQLSPRATSRARSPPHHRHVVDDLGDEGDNDFTPSAEEPQRVAIAPPPKAEGSIPESRGTVSKRENAIRPSLAVDTTDVAAVVKQNIAVKRKASVFRGFFLDLRKMSSADKISLGEDLEVSQSDRHRFSMIPKVSLPALRLRVSIATFSTRRLRRKSTQQQTAAGGEVEGRDSGDNSSDDDVEISNVGGVPKAAGAKSPQEAPKECKITAADTVITHFDTTPFSQRYHDARKAELQQIRSLIEDSIDDDDEEDDDLVLGFEHNVPDHFPNSPLCPLHPKHKSGGRAICPQHRRYRKSTAGKVVKVGPARSYRVVSYTRIAPSESAQHSSPPRSVQPFSLALSRSEESTRVAVRDEAARARRRMGSDGASTGSSAGSREWYPMRKPAWTNNTVAAANMEWRGRSLLRNGCGSKRRPRRLRIQGR